MNLFDLETQLRRVYNHPGMLALTLPLPLSLPLPLPLTLPLTLTLALTPNQVCSRCTSASCMG